MNAGTAARFHRAALEMLFLTMPIDVVVYDVPDSSEQAISSEFFQGDKY
jgi:hypothetical protein